MANKKRTLIPFVSVIIPVYNAQATLNMCLESVDKLDYPNDKYEVIVVDNGSTDASIDIAQKFDVKILHENAIRSSYAARNTGIKEARGELIAFTDSDCIVTHGWLKNLVQDWDDETIGCFAGEIEAYQPITLVERFSDRMGILRQKGTLNCFYLPYTQTANSAYRKDVFEKIGLFIPEMTSGGDGEISWRMQKKLGLKIKFIPEALVYHKHRTNILGLYRQFEKYEKGKFFFKKYYPDYNLPPFNQRQEELKVAMAKVKFSFLSDFEKYIEGKIDLVQFATPFLMLVIRCGAYAAWSGKDTGFEKGAVFENLDLEKFVLRIQEIISELEPTELLYASGEMGEKVQILAERNKRLAEQVAEKSSQLEEKEQYIRSLLVSRSWKITAPLRKIMGMLTKQ